MRLQNSAVQAPSTTLSCVAGRVFHLETCSRPQLPCHVFVPPDPHPDNRILVSVHGVSRNAEEHIELLRPFAERYGVVLLAPLFAADRFPDYQRLGRKRQGPRADLALIRLLNGLQNALGLDTSCVDLFGFSGGAQFAHRFAMAHPLRVRRLSLGAAGWYTMPDRSLSYPYGVRDARGLDGVRMHVTMAARLPTLVLVGEDDDCAEDEELNRSTRVRRRQGNNRRERAQNWVREMNGFAAGACEPAVTSLLVMPGVDHSFRTAVVEGSLGMHVFEHLYEAPASTRLQPMGRLMRQADHAGQDSVPTQPGMENR